MIVLAIDTSTTRGSVALIDGERVLLEETFTSDRSHGSLLIPVLQRARELAAKPAVIAVGLGPGSYAGVRIAIATAMGLSMATGARLVGIPSVASLEGGARAYLAVGDARRETFYFTRVEDGQCVEGPLLLDETGFRARLGQWPRLPVLVPEPLATVPNAIVARPLALGLARLAAAGRSVVAEGELEPLYLREPHITQPKAR
jgi:tRNA threonylcarbamoyladenosine biosynthesis protein TsaB